MFGDYDFSDGSNWEEEEEQGRELDINDFESIDEDTMTFGKITSKIVSTKVKSKDEDGIPTTHNILERDEIITGKTYKTKVGEYAYYITINDMELNGIKRPYEIFINSKNVETYANLTVLTRLISAFLRTGHDYVVIVDELKQIVNPKGGYFKKSKRYESFEAELGDILEKHIAAMN